MSRIPYRRPFVVGAPGGGGASLPDTPDAVLADAASPDSVVMLDETGAGVALGVQEFVATTGEVPAESDTQTGGSTGWTIANGTGAAAATGTAYTLSFTSGTASNVAPASDNPRLLRSLASVYKPLYSRWVVTARVVSAPDDSSYRLSIAVGATNLSAGVVCVIGRSGASAGVELGTYSPSYSPAVSAGGSLPVDGTGWVRLIFAGGRVTLEYGTGTTTAQPSSWLTHGSVVATYAWESQILYLTRWAGSNGLGGSFDDVTAAGYP